MPKVSKRQKRPRDVVGNAIHVMKILTGEIEEAPETDDGKDPAAKAMGRKGGAARAASMTAERRAGANSPLFLARWLDVAPRSTL
jgi:hypothetical protein